jgi:predicted HicB family RNase H-like nuclease
MSKQDYVSTSLRSPLDVHKALHSEAKKSERSFNGEIIARLRRSLEQDGALEVPAQEQKGSEQ